MTQPAAKSERYLRVSELNQLLHSTLETQLPVVAVEGEISEFTRAASGHLYFTIADDKAQFPVVMWRGMAQGVTFELKRGLAVQIHGKPAVYQVNGKLQLVAHRVLLAGDGLLQKRFLELKEKLEREGLFADGRKRRLPFLPRAIGIVTSAKGAVVHDIMVRLAERMPQIPTFLCDVRVQGDGAALEIAEAIRHFNRLANVDVLIVGRGGGSLEDLWAFNEEPVVRAIFASAIPIISAVGHEVDTTLADLVADKRAPTPTAAAEMVVPIRAELLKMIGERARRLLNTTTWFEPRVQQCDELESRLCNRIGWTLRESTLRLASLEGALRGLRPEALISKYRARIGQLSSRLAAALTFERIAAHRSTLGAVERRLLGGSVQAIKAAGERCKRAEVRLAAIHPQRVLERGYAIVSTGGKAVRDGDTIQVGNMLDLRFAKGGAQAKVI